MLQKQIFLARLMKNQINSTNWDSKEIVWACEYYLNLNLNDSATLVIDECLIFWYDFCNLHNCHLGDLLMIKQF